MGLARSRLGLIPAAFVALLVAGGAWYVAHRPTGPAAPAVPHFVDVTASSGLDQTFEGGYLYAAAGGLATFDCNDDGRPDLYVAGGVNSAALFRNDSPPGGSIRFSRVADPVTDLTDVTGAYPIDIDGDGNTDLVVLRAGASRILRGLGDCRFEDVGGALGFDGFPGLTTAFSATWEGTATLPTFAFGHYLAMNADGTAGTSCADSELLRPAPGGKRYGAPEALSPSYCPLSMLFTDWSHSGRRDLRVSNDRAYYDNTVGEEQLWHVPPGGPPTLYGPADGWARTQIEGMGIASQDLNGDGLPEVFLTSQSASRLQTLASGSKEPAYTDIGLKRGVNAAQPYTGDEHLPSTAWHPEFEDVNNDGLLDLFVSKGNVDAQPDYAQKDPSNLLLERPDGTFVESGMAAGIATFDRGRGASLADFNLDGLLDLVLVNKGAGVIVWQNVGSGTAAAPAPMGHWLGLEVRQDGPNHDAIGGWLEVRVGTQVTSRELTVGGGHISGQLGWLHFGLGAATSADVRVQWPDGTFGPWLNVPADELAIVARDATNAVRFDPPGS